MNVGALFQKADQLVDDIARLGGPQTERQAELYADALRKIEAARGAASAEQLGLFPFLLIGAIGSGLVASIMVLGELKRQLPKIGDDVRKTLGTAQKIILVMGGIWVWTVMFPRRKAAA